MRGEKVDQLATLIAKQKAVIQLERTKRTQVHKQRTAAIRRGVDHRRALAQQLPAQPLDFLAIGDSWFDYPLNGDSVSFSNTDIIAQLQNIGNPPPTILNYAVRGQATTAVLSYENQQQMIDVLSDPTHWINGSPDAILVSAGGDDIVGDQFAIYLDYHGAGLNVPRFQGALASVQASYEDLFAFRDIFAPNKIIIGHCYDYAIPDGVGVCFLGPWLQPSLSFAGYDYNDGLAIVQQMITMFHDILQGLAGSGPGTNNFLLVDTRNTIIRDASSPNGWANEIHPYPAGFLGIAQKFVTALRGVPAFAGRI